MAFKTPLAEKVLKYAKEKYHSHPEFLWAKFPNYAVLRCTDNSKWYAVLMTIPKRKLGIDEDGDVEILDLKCDPLMTGALRDGKRYFPAYHMNKEHWITLILDGSIPEKDIFSNIDMAYDLVCKF